MTKIHAWILLLGLALLIGGCAPDLGLTPTAAPSPTLTISAGPSELSTLAPAPTPTPQPNCADSALFIADITIADNTNLQPGQPFTKTWQLRNNGTCTWNSEYALVFNGGDRLDSPAAVPLSETAPKATLNLSVNLVAPASDGAFTGLYELHNPQGQAIPIGLTKIMWVKITVGSVVLAVQPTLSAPATPTLVFNNGAGQPAGATPTVRPKSGRCQPDRDGNYTAQVLAFINNARAAAGLSRLSVSAQLTASAQAHSDDMACHSLLSHTGSDGSSIYTRILAAGYSPAYWEEIIFGSGFPQQAFSWWMNDPPHKDGILDPKVTDFGAGFSYWAGSEYGSYYTVDFGRP